MRYIWPAGISHWKKNKLGIAKNRDTLLLIFGPQPLTGARDVNKVHVSTQLYTDILIRFAKILQFISYPREKPWLLLNIAETLRY